MRCDDALAAAVARISIDRDASCEVRVVEEETRDLAVVRGVAQPSCSSADAGAMLTVRVNGGIGYSASADLGADGLQRAASRALEWARACARGGLFAGVALPAPASDVLVERDSPADKPLGSDRELLDLLRAEAAVMRRDPRIVSWSASLRIAKLRQRLYADGRLYADQRFSFVQPNLEATASDAKRSQSRSLAGQYNGFCQQGGFEVIERSGLPGGGARVADEALRLLAAPNCPSGAMSLLLMPDQMMLQIHESIGHPLELDRILGDERNFAGTSFVRPEMFGSYRYGSALLNVSFDPTIAAQYASYALDDTGAPARKTMLIERGVLLRPLGGALSQARARAAGFGLEGTANARASGWHRPAIDRMANLNVEPGDSTLAQMIAGIERGVLMRTNASWSIDDSRNKFQFGCEWGELIEDGQVRGVVRNPNYRGVSSTFWRSLSKVGDLASFEAMGTPYCGKGEPGQVIRVGHASPPCVFENVDVFGAAD